jgi:energy-coupling factor transporter ATP-binding protein EcfA2
MSDPILRTRALTKRFGGLVAVSDVSLDLHVGEVHVVIGPNGAGKSTLTNLLSGDLPATSGRVMLDGRDIAGLQFRPDLAPGRRPQLPEDQHLPALHGIRECRLAAQSRTPHALRVFIAPRLYRGDQWLAECGHGVRGPHRTAPSGSPPRFRTASSASSKSPCASRRSRACCCSTSRWPAWGRTNRSAWWN